MADCLVDTNVLIIASAAREPGFPDITVSVDDVEVVFEWLRTFRDDPSRRIVLDEFFRIYAEYNKKLTGQHFGLQVVSYKMSSWLRTVPVEYDEHGHAHVPATLADIDRSDKKFVAAALNDPARICVVFATDRGWKRHREVLQAHGVVVQGLLP